LFFLFFVFILDLVREFSSVWKNFGSRLKKVTLMKQIDQTTQLSVSNDIAGTEL
jgi:hypothetical protein